MSSILLLIIGLAAGASGLKKFDVEPYINQLEERLESLAMPDPDIVEEFVRELQATCNTNRTIDLTMMQNMSSCMESLFNGTDLATEIRESVPKGDLDVVFRNLCLKWPDMKACMEDGFEVIGDCWGQGLQSQVVRGMDTAVGFFCGAENDGARVALFIAEDGMACLEKYGRSVGECLTSEAVENDLEDVCDLLENLHHCLPILKNCTNVTPENLISSMVAQVGKVLECPPPKKTIQPNSAGHAMKDLRTALTQLVEGARPLLNFSEALESFRTECGRQNIEIDFEEIIAATENCTGLTMLPNDISSVRQLRPSRVCHFVLQAAECIEPYRDLLLNCSAEAHVALNLAEEMCKNNGAVLDGIFGSVRRDCSQRRTAVRNFLHCSDKYSKHGETKVSLYADKLRTNFCGTASVLKHCVVEMLSKCRKQNAFKRTNQLLTEAEERNGALKDCLNTLPAPARVGSNTNTGTTASAKGTDSLMLTLIMITLHFFYLNL